MPVKPKGSKPPETPPQKPDNTQNAPESPVVTSKPPEDTQDTLEEDEGQEEAPAKPESKKRLTGIASLPPTKINLRTVPGKVIQRDEDGYQFENVAFRYDIPMSVMMEGVKARLPDRAMEEFVRAEGRLNQYAIHTKTHKLKSKNGVISVRGGEDYTMPQVGPEIYLRIILDRFKNDPAFRAFYEKEVDRVYIQKRLENVIREVTSE